MKALPPDPIAEPPSPSKIRNLPNALTALRLLLVPLFGWLLLRDGGDDTASRVWAFVDLRRGHRRPTISTARSRVAVRSSRRSARSPIPSRTKPLMGMALVGLSILGELPWWVTIVILVREIGVTLLRFWVIRHGVIAAGRGGKLKTALQALAISLYLLPLSGPAATLRAWVMAAAVVVTVVTGLHYVVKAVRLRRTPASHPAAA